MKPLKVLIAIGLVLNLTIKLQAQDIRFGFLTGLVGNNANVPDKIEVYKHYRVFYPLYGFSINGFIEYKISEKLGITAEPGFIRKGGIGFNEVSHYTSDINMKLHYLQLPILANFYFTDKFFVSAGPEFAGMINSKENLPPRGSGLNYFKENAFEVSGLIGLNYSISMKVGIGVRYNHGFTKIATITWTDGYGPVIGESNVYNQYFQFILRLNLQKRAETTGVLKTNIR